MTVVEENNKYVTRDLISWKRSSWYTDAYVQSIYEQKVVEKGEKRWRSTSINSGWGAVSSTTILAHSVCSKIERSFIYKWDTMTTAADDDFYQHVLCHNNYYFYDLNLPPVWREGWCWWWWYINKNNSAHTRTHTQICVNWMSVPDDILIWNDEYDEIMIIIIKIL